MGWPRLFGAEPDASGLFDADDVPQGKVFHGMLDGHFYTIFLELVMVAPRCHMFPSIGFQRLDNFSAADHS